MEKIRVLLVEDHALVREGISSLLRSYKDIEVVGEAMDGSQALSQVCELRPDIVLMDITLPGMSGLEATQVIRRDCPDVQVVALTVHSSSEYLFGMLRAGASGYIVKGGSSEELVSALRAVKRGGVYLHPSVAGKLAHGYPQRLKSNEYGMNHNGLTKREREVLRLIGEGRTYQEIADRMCLSRYTVQTHRSRIMNKLDLHSQAQLIKYAVKGAVNPALSSE